MKKIGFIGIGVMGRSMARNLMKQGFEVSVFTHTKAKAEELLKEGAFWRNSVGELAAGQDAVITMIGYPKDVDEVYFGKTGILENAEKGAYVIDMTTTSPHLSIEIFNCASKLGLHAIDAPVSGGDVGAQKGTLSIMVGGKQEDYEACLPIFKAMGTNIVYQGPAGSGQHTKMANQIALGGAIAGVCEAIAYAKAVGLNPDIMLRSISAGAAGSWQMSNMAPRMLAGDMEPGFFIKHYIKDMNIACEEAEQASLHLSILEDVRKMYCQLADNGLAGKGTQALIKYYEK